MINSAVFISAGLGDAILLVPLVKKLKESGRKVTGIFSSDFNCEEIFEGTSLFDEQLLFPSETNNKISRTAIVLKHIRKFDEVYLNYFSCTRSNFMLASVISKKVISNRIPNGFPQMLLLNLSYVEPKENIHDSTQNLRLFDSSVTDKDIREDMFLVPFRPVCLLPDFDKIKNNGKTIAVQISSGNNIHKYKNWPTEHWAEFLLRATQTFPKINFVMIGEPNETAISEELMKRGFPNLFSFVGRTN
jgi:ADP-heptose:LPS heptosyltransferase